MLEGLIALSAFALTTAGVQARANDPKSAATPAATKPAAPNKAQRYCVMNFATGSRVGHKVCKTREQWLQEDGFDPLAPEEQ
jgi:hypothetical protein